MLKLSTDSIALQLRSQEYALKPAEAFLSISINDFPITELRNRLNLITRENLHIKKGQPVELYRDGETGEVVIRQDLEKTKTPIWNKTPKSPDRRGCVVMYEPPVMKKPPKGLYKIGYDPYRQILGTSLACILVFKTVLSGNSTKNLIVAEYIGRPSEPDDVNRLAEYLCELYNAELMFENEVTHVMTYFKRRNKLHLLAVQPDSVISANVKNSKVARVYGCHMVDKLKDAGEKYTKQWLLEEVEVDEYGNKLINIDYIYSPGFLEELLEYNRTGNFDRVSAFFMVMFQIQEDIIGKEYSSDKNNENKSSLVNHLKKLYRR